MIASPYLLLSVIYLVCLIGAIVLAKREVNAKRDVIKNKFGLEGQSICDAYAEPKMGKLTMLSWALAFVFAGVLVQTWIISGSSLTSIWLQTLLIELGFLIIGLLVFKIADIGSWYTECFATSHKPYYYSIIIMAAAIIFSNVSYVLPMFFGGIAAQVAAILLMLLALGFLIWPIHIEHQYYRSSDGGVRFNLLGAR
jgi:hypothetical protein